MRPQTESELAATRAIAKAIIKKSEAEKWKRLGSEKPDGATRQKHQQKAPHQGSQMGSHTEVIKMMTDNLILLSALVAIALAGAGSLALLLYVIFRDVESGTETALIIKAAIYEITRSKE